MHASSSTSELFTILFLLELVEHSKRVVTNIEVRWRIIARDGRDLRNREGRVVLFVVHQVELFDDVLERLPLALIFAVAHLGFGLLGEKSNANMRFERARFTSALWECEAERLVQTDQRTRRIHFGLEVNSERTATAEDLEL